MGLVYRLAARDAVSDAGAESIQSSQQMAMRLPAFSTQNDHSRVEGSLPTWHVEVVDLNVGFSKSSVNSGVNSSVDSLTDWADPTHPPRAVNLRGARLDPGRPLPG